MRGEQPLLVDTVAALEGPSPRARGAAGERQLVGHPEGAIPACAGSRRRRRTSQPARGGHPRVRGEQTA
ncbi:hypothetical protein STXM2123_4537 [Streptomyces sp. F-3]|nr:hypothetical protein STXM2123_4537 [Streptomyces sp. F-3]